VFVLVRRRELIRLREQVARAMALEASGRALLTPAAVPATEITSAPGGGSSSSDPGMIPTRP
jgi:hypothetical protein